MEYGHFQTKRYIVNVYIYIYTYVYCIPILQYFMTLLYCTVQYSKCFTALVLQKNWPRFEWCSELRGPAHGPAKTIREYPHTNVD